MASNIKIKDWSIEERPREKMLLNGAKNTIDGSVKSTSNLYSENTIVSTFKNY